MINCNIRRRHKMLIKIAEFDFANSVKFKTLDDMTWNFVIPTCTNILSLCHVCPFFNLRAKLLLKMCKCVVSKSLYAVCVYVWWLIHVQILWFEACIILIKNRVINLYNNKINLLRLNRKAWLVFFHTREVFITILILRRWSVTRMRMMRLHKFFLQQRR